MDFHFTADNMLTATASGAAVLLGSKRVTHAGTTVYFVKGDACAWHVLADDARVLVIGAGRAWTAPFTAADKTLLTTLFAHVVVGAAGGDDDPGDEDVTLAVEEEKRFTYTVMTVPTGMQSFLADRTYKDVVVTPAEALATLQTACEEGRYAPEIARRSDGTVKVYLRIGASHKNVSEADFAVVVATLKAAKAAWIAAGKPGGVTKKRMRV